MISANYIIVASASDEAGMNIVQPLMSVFRETEKDIPDHWPEGNYTWYEYEDAILLIMSEPHYKAEFLSNSFRTHHIIVASKHLSSAAQKAILVHPLGNWSESRHESGFSRQIAPINASALTRMLRMLQNQYVRVENSEYWVGVEATHHGPTSLDVPIMFVEVGGTVVEWNDKEACAIAGRAILAFIREKDEPKDTPAILGIGGGHYAPAFLRRVDHGMFNLGHILPKFGIELLDESLLRQAWAAIQDENKLILIDKSGTKSAQRTYLIELIERAGLPYAMTSEYPTPKS